MAAHIAAPMSRPKADQALVTCGEIGMAANIAAPMSRPKTDQALMTNFLRTQTEYTPHSAERGLNSASSTDPYLLPTTAPATHSCNPDMACRDWTAWLG